MAETRDPPDDPNTEEATAAEIPAAKRAPRDGAAEKSRAGTLSEASRIGRFVVLRKLGEGGMGIVYNAYDEELDRKVAVKLLHPRTASPDARGRLAREAQAMARLSHPNVVAIYEVGDFDGQVFVAMEFVPGQTLRAFIREKKPTQREMIDAYLQAARGLAAAHRSGLVHRDFKPDNVIVGDDGRVRVLDFGLARFIGDREETKTEGAEPAPMLPPDGSALRTPLTQEGAIMGTPAYMAPEQLGGETVTEHTDQFSFCVAFYLSLYGQHPFPGENFGERLTSMMSQTISEAPKDSPVPLWLRSALVRGMARHSVDRWPSMDALIAEIERGLGEDPELNTSLLKRRRFWAIVPLAIVSVGILLAVTLFGKLKIPTAKVALQGGASSAVIFLIVIALARRTLFSPPNRMFSISLLCGIFFLLSHRVLAYAMDQPVAHILSSDLLILAASLTLVAATVDKWFFCLPLLFVLAAISIGPFPEHSAIIFGIATTAALPIVLLLFRRRAGA